MSGCTKVGWRVWIRYRDCGRANRGAITAVYPGDSTREAGWLGAGEGLGGGWETSWTRLTPLTDTFTKQPMCEWACAIREEVRAALLSRCVLAVVQYLRFGCLVNGRSKRHRTGSSPSAAALGSAAPAKCDSKKRVTGEIMGMVRVCIEVAWASNRGPWTVAR